MELQFLPNKIMANQIETKFLLFDIHVVTDLSKFKFSMTKTMLFKLKLQLI